MTDQQPTLPEPDEFTRRSRVIRKQGHHIACYHYSLTCVLPYLTVACVNGCGR